MAGQFRREWQVQCQCVIVQYQLQAMRESLTGDCIRIYFRASSLSLNFLCFPLDIGRSSREPDRSSRELRGARPDPTDCFDMFFTVEVRYAFLLSGQFHCIIPTTRPTRFYVLGWLRDTLFVLVLRVPISGDFFNKIALFSYIHTVRVQFYQFRFGHSSIPYAKIFCIQVNRRELYCSNS